MATKPFTYGPTSKAAPPAPASAAETTAASALSSALAPVAGAATTEREADNLRASSLPMYHLTIRPSDAVVAAASGSFSAAKTQEIVVAGAGGTSLLLFAAEASGKLRRVAAQRFFTTIRAIAVVPPLVDAHVAALATASSGGPTDTLAVTCDSGKVTLLRFVPNPAAAGSATGSVSGGGSWVVQATSTLGKTGVRRCVVGEYIVADPGGRCVFVSALERQKFMLPITRDAETGALAFAAPLEAHRSAVVHAVCALDTADQNPAFAVIEHPQDAAQPLDKQLCVYEYDLGLNHAVRTFALSVPSGANHLVALPGGARGPGGVLLCAEDEVLWVHPGAAQHVPARVPLPRREDLSFDVHDLLITASALVRIKEDFFCVLQNELGDVFRVTMEWRTTAELHVRYFDTLPPSSAFVMLRRGFLFSASEASSLNLYQVVKDGYSDDGYITHNALISVGGGGGGAATTNGTNVGDANGGDSAELGATVFTRSVPVFPRHPLTNLRCVDSLPSVAPLVQMALWRPSRTNAAGGGLLAGATGGSGGASGSSASLLAADAAVAAAGSSSAPATFLLLHGRGPQSHLSSMKYGVQMALERLLTLPMPCDALWPLPECSPPDAAAAAAPNRNNAGGGVGGSFDCQVLLSNRDSSIVMRFLVDTDGTIAAVQPDSSTRFELMRPTLAVARLAQNCGVVQVHSGGFRHVVGSRHQHDWHHPLHKTVTKAAANENQLLIAFAHGGVSYFELDRSGPRLAAVGGEFLGQVEVTCVSLPSRSPALFCGVGFVNREFHIYSLARGSRLFSKPTSALECDAAISSCRMEHLEDGRLYAFLGLADGTLVQITVDPVAGTALNMASFLLCHRGDSPSPCRLVATVMDHCCYAAADGQLWRCTAMDSGASSMTVPVMPSTGVPAAAVAAATAFCVFRVPPTGRQVLISVGPAGLHMFNVARGEEQFSFEHVSLFNQGRRFVTHPTLPLAVVASHEHRGMSTTEFAASGASAAPGDAVRDPQTRSPLGAGVYASSLQVVDVNRMAGIGEPKPLAPKHTVLCITFANFSEAGRDPVLVVGVANDFAQNPLQHRGGSLLLFRMVPSAARSSTGQVLEFVHATPIRCDGAVSEAARELLVAAAGGDGAAVAAGDAPVSLHACNDVLLVGLSDATNGVYVYAWGRSKLLFKSRLSIFSSGIAAIASFGTSVAVGEMRNSAFLCQFRDATFGAQSHNTSSSAVPRLSLLAEDPMRRRVVAMCMVDRCTLGVSDRFGNVAFLRASPMLLDTVIRDDDDDFPQGSYASRTFPKLAEVAAFHVGAIVVSLQRTSATSVDVSNGGREAVVYATVTGAVGCFLPFATTAEWIHAQHLQMTMRVRAAPAVGRDHAAYRGQFFPTRYIIDGDFVEELSKMPAADRAAVEGAVQKELVNGNRLCVHRGEQEREFTTTAVLVASLRALATPL